MIKAIIFDCFGVLTTDGWLPFKEKYFGHDEDLLRQATDLNHRVDAGLMGYKAMIHEVAQLAGVSEATAERAIDDNVTNEALFQYVATELKPQYKLGMLSNAGANWLGELFKPEQVALFDAIALSYETGFVKPDERAYQTIAERLGVDMFECIFIDDQERFCTAASEQGMQALVYTSVAELKKQLPPLLQA